MVTELWKQVVVVVAQHWECNQRQLKTVKIINVIYIFYHKNKKLFLNLYNMSLCWLTLSFPPVLCLSGRKLLHT